MDTVLKHAHEIDPELGENPTDSARYITAKVGGKEVGRVDFYDTAGNKGLWIGNLSVDDEYRRHGIGVKLFEEMSRRYPDKTVYHNTLSEMGHSLVHHLIHERKLPNHTVAPLNKAGSAASCSDCMHHSALNNPCSYCQKEGKDDKPEFSTSLGWAACARHRQEWDERIKSEEGDDAELPDWKSMAELAKTGAWFKRKQPKKRPDWFKEYNHLVDTCQNCGKPVCLYQGTHWTHHENIGNTESHWADCFDRPWDDPRGKPGATPRYGSRSRPQEKCYSCQEPIYEDAPGEWVHTEGGHVNCQMGVGFSSAYPSGRDLRDIDDPRGHRASTCTECGGRIYQANWNAAFHTAWYHEDSDNLLCLGGDGAQATPNDAQKTSTIDDRHEDDFDDPRWDGTCVNCGQPIEQYSRDGQTSFWVHTWDARIPCMYHPAGKRKRTTAEPGLHKTFKESSEPDAKGKKVAYMAVGISGAGKSTYLKPFAQTIGAKYLSTDGIREELTGNEANYGVVEDQVFDTLFKRMHEGLDNEGQIVVDATYTHPMYRGMALSHLKKKADEVHALVFDVPLETAIKRNSQRERKVPEDVIRTMHKRLQEHPPTTDEGFTSVRRIEEPETREASADQEWDDPRGPVYAECEKCDLKLRNTGHEWFHEFVVGAGNHYAYRGVDGHVPIPKGQQKTSSDVEFEKCVSCGKPIRQTNKGDWVHRMNDPYCSPSDKSLSGWATAYPSGRDVRDFDDPRGTRKSTCANCGKPIQQSYVNATYKNSWEHEGSLAIFCETDWPQMGLQATPTDTQKTSSWRDVQLKAVRMRNAGRINLISHEPDIVTADVQGDHGNYRVELYRQYPGERNVTLWDCECLWDDYCWGTSAARRKFEGRMCSHALGTLYETLGRERGKAASVKIPAGKHEPRTYWADCSFCGGDIYSIAFEGIGQTDWVHDTTGVEECERNISRAEDDPRNRGPAEPKPDTIRESIEKDDPRGEANATPKTSAIEDTATEERAVCSNCDRAIFRSSVFINPDWCHVSNLGRECPTGTPLTRKNDDPRGPTEAQPKLGSYSAAEEHASTKPQATCANCKRPIYFAGHQSYTTRTWYHNSTANAACQKYADDDDPRGQEFTDNKAEPPAHTVCICGHQHGDHVVNGCIGCGFDCRFTPAAFRSSAAQKLAAPETDGYGYMLRENDDPRGSIKDECVHCGKTIESFRVKDDMWWFHSGTKKSFCYSFKDGNTRGIAKPKNMGKMSGRTFWSDSDECPVCGELLTAENENFHYQHSHPMPESADVVRHLEVVHDQPESKRVEKTAMEVRKAPMYGIEDAVRKANEKYQGNIRIKSMAGDASGGRFTLAVHDAHGMGHRDTFWNEGGRRHSPSACWHVFRDVLQNFFDAYPDAYVRTGIATYKGKQGFENTFPRTYYKGEGKPCVECAGNGESNTRERDDPRGPLMGECRRCDGRGFSHAFGELCHCDNDFGEDMPRTASAGSQLVIYGKNGRVVQLDVEVAEDMRDIKQGLMNRPYLPRNQGMVFLYSQPRESHSAFWMKNVQIPLSLAVWDRGGRIEQIIDMEPCSGSPCPSYKPQRGYWGAVEVNKGWFQSYGLGVGDRIELKR